MKRKLFAGLLAGLLILSLSGCGWFVSFFKLDQIPSVTAEPTAEPTTEPTTAAPTTLPPASDPSGLPSVPDESTEPTLSQPDPTAPTMDPDEPRVVGVSSKGYQIVEEKGLTYVNGVLIVNKTYGVPQNYGPGDLTPECRAAFSELVAGAAADGIEIFMLSGFRSYETQTGLYNRYVAQDGQAAADTYSARPGHSEHQTGLALDVNSISYSFADTPEGQWLAANAHKYGFIIRYGRDKQSLTGYAYEPWHIRYLGKGMAAAVYESGLCLEEYFGITSVYA